MLIRDILRGKGSFVATIQPDATIGELLTQLAEHNIGALVVSVNGAAVSGIVSERDVVRALQTAGGDLLTATVAMIMTKDVTVTRPADSVESVMRMMTERRIRHVPVVTDGRLEGIISIGDVVKSRINELETEREHLIGYISSGG
jgi:CBS domain-containing protein